MDDEDAKHKKRVERKEALSKAQKKLDRARKAVAKAREKLEAANADVLKYSQRVGALSRGYMPRQAMKQRRVSEAPVQGSGSKSKSKSESESDSDVVCVTRTVTMGGGAGAGGGRGGGGGGGGSGGAGGGGGSFVKISGGGGICAVASGPGSSVVGLQSTFVGDKSMTLLGAPLNIGDLIRKALSGHDGPGPGPGPGAGAGSGGAGGGGSTADVDVDVDADVRALIIQQFSMLPNNNMCVSVSGSGTCNAVTFTGPANARSVTTLKMCLQEGPPTIFSPQDSFLTEAPYKIRFIKPDGTRYNPLHHPEVVMAWQQHLIRKEAVTVSASPVFERPSAHEGGLPKTEGRLRFSLPSRDWVSDKGVKFTGCVLITIPNAVLTAAEMRHVLHTMHLPVKQRVIPGATTIPFFVVRDGQVDGSPAYLVPWHQNVRGVVQAYPK